MTETYYIPAIIRTKTNGLQCSKRCQFWNNGWCMFDVLHAENVKKQRSETCNMLALTLDMSPDERGYGND